MRKLVVIAALALFATSAHAEVHEMKFGGRIVRIEVPKNCNKPSCIQVSSTQIGKARKGRAAPASSTAPAVSNAPAARTVAALPQEAARPATVRSSAQGAAQGAAQRTLQSNAAPKNEPQVEREPDGRKPIARLSLPANPAVEEPKPAVVATATAASVNEARIEPVKPAEPTPIGLWITEKNEGKVRIEECGQALCGFTEGKPNEKILINMQPAEKNRWNGKVHDVRNGSTYVSHMSLRNANSLRVEGCAFGGLFCGGETWTRAAR